MRKSTAFERLETRNVRAEVGRNGNRIAKHVYDNQTLMLEKSTYYILDAQGNQLSMYEHIVDDADVKYYLTERNIYGSSRLGTLKDPVNMFDAKPLPSYGILGNRNYELSNHLGNVLTVISDIKYPLSSDNTTIDSYEVGISNIFDYSPFGAPLDGRTMQNIFHQEEFTDTFTVVKTIYVLEETFDVASDWQDVASYSQISYPSGKMRVRNSSTTKRTIGAKKNFVTGEGLHEVSFDITSLPSFICEYQPPFPPIGIGINSDSTTTTSGIGGNATLNVVIKDQSNNVVVSDSFNVADTYSHLSFSATEGNTYSIEFYIINACNSSHFEVDDVFIAHEEDVVVESKNYVVSNSYRYGFNGMERDDNVKGAGNSYDFGARMYDSRLGRWLSRDALERKKPYLSPYQAYKNNPIIFNDPDGKDEYLTIVIDDKRTGRKTTIELQTAVSTKIRTDWKMKNAGTSLASYNYYDYKTIVTLTIDESGNKSVDTQYDIMYENGVRDNDFAVGNYSPKSKPDLMYTIFHSSLEGDGGSQSGGLRLTTEEGGVSTTKYISENDVKSVDITSILAAFGAKGKSMAKPSEIEEGVGIITELYKEISGMAEGNNKGFGSGSNSDTGSGGMPKNDLKIVDDSVNVTVEGEGKFRIHKDSLDGNGWGYPNKNNSKKIQENE